jgi:hypothetical protein
MFKCQENSIFDWKTEQDNIITYKGKETKKNKEINKDRFNILREDVKQGREEIIAWTDGAFKEGISVSGVVYVHQKLWNLSSKVMLNPPPYSNIRGEL